MTKYVSVHFKFQGRMYIVTLKISVENISYDKCYDDILVVNYIHFVVIS